ncbi:MAG: hypothetical protein CMD72_05320 [Gammaproteobacteria bacterium]|nr:hypothetical protein [Gammaproteobacteria bacterium]
METIENERTIQNVFDDERENENRIEEIKEELKELKQELKERTKNIKILEEERKSLQIDLLKEKKLEWIESDLNGWRNYIEENDDKVTYYIYQDDSGGYKEGYYKGEFQLNEKDNLHFEKYFNDYFYYGEPNYQDVNDPNHEGSECYLAFGSGSSYVKSFEWN